MDKNGWRCFYNDPPSDDITRLLAYGDYHDEHDKEYVVLEKTYIDSDDNECFCWLDKYFYEQMFSWWMELPKPPVGYKTPLKDGKVIKGRIYAVDKEK